MSLRLIYGRSGVGKSTYCLKEIKERLENSKDTPLVLLVPEQFSLQAEKNLVKKVGAGGIMKAEVLSFRRLAYRIFNEVGGLTHKHISSAGRCMLMYRVVDRLKDRLTVFSKAAEQKGFVNTLCDTVAEMKRYNVTPQALRSISTGIEEDGLLKDKLTEISLIYDEYEKELHQRYIDSDDELTLLLDKLEESRLFNGGEIWIDEFSGFTPQEYKVIEKLFKKAERVSVCLCTDCLIDERSIDCADVFAPVKRTAEKLLKTARSAGVHIEDPIRLEHSNGRFKSSSEIGHMERHFFSFPYEAYMKETRDISIFSAANIFSEVENTARDIVALCRDKGLRYGDIAVVTRNLAGYEKILASVFTEYGIPYFIDRKKDITGHPLVQLILSLFDVFISNWSYEPVFRYLKTGLTGIDRESIDVIENYVLAFGIRGKLWTEDREWDYCLNSGFEGDGISEQEESLIKRVNEVRRNITAPLIEFYSKVRGKNKARNICTALYELLCELGVPERIEEQVEGFKDKGEFGLANEYGQIWNFAIELLDQVVEVMGDEIISLARFRKTLEIGVGEYKMGLIPPSLDQVLVGSVERSKSHNISALYVLGVNDGVFPASTFSEGILSDKDRGKLEELGLELAQDSRSSAFEEQFLIYSTITTAGKYLKLSYPIADHEGKTMRPSIIISRLRKVFPNITEYSNVATGNQEQDSLELVTTPVPTFNELVSRVRRYVDGCEINPLWWDVYRWYAKDDEWKEKREAIMTGLFYSNQVKSIKRENAEKIYSRPLYTSVSRLESYTACPFSYYVKYGLRAKERKIFRLNAPDVGTFMHTVIDIFSKRLRENGMDWRTLENKWCQREISNIVDDLLKKVSRSILNSSSRYIYLSERLKRTLVRAVQIISEHIRRGSFNPIGYEVAFGHGEKFPPITLELPSGEKIYLTGRVDRIDALKTEEGTYVRIIDYKSGSKAFKLSDVYYGLQLQLITYMDAILNGVGSNMLPGGVFYFKIDDPIVKGSSGMTEEEIEKAIMKELKMKGLVLADVKLVREMDKEIEGDSLVIPARINKGDVLGKSSAATVEQFNAVCRHVKKLLANIASEMLEGKISISPYKINKSTSCKYCPYHSVCQFDPSFDDNKYRVLNSAKDNEIWKLLR